MDVQPKIAIEKGSGDIIYEPNLISNGLLKTTGFSRACSYAYNCYRLAAKFAKEKGILRSVWVVFSCINCPLKTCGQ